MALRKRERQQQLEAFAASRELPRSPDPPLYTVL